MEQILSCKEEDKCYPTVFRGLSGMPSMLYYRGNIEILNRYKSVAIVGGESLLKLDCVFHMRLHD